MNLFIINLTIVLSKYIQSNSNLLILHILNHIVFFKQNQENYNYEIYILNKFEYELNVDDYNTILSYFENENNKININNWFENLYPLEYIFNNIQNIKTIKEQVKIFKKYINFEYNLSNLFDNNKTYNNVLNLYSSNYNLLSLFFQYKIKYNNILCCDNNDILNQILILCILL